MSPYHPTSDAFPAAPGTRPPAPLALAFANLFADFSPDFADALAPALFFACVSLATLFFFAASAAASRESSFLTGVFLVFAAEFLLGEGLGVGFRVGWGGGLGVGVGVTVGLALGSSISLFTAGAGSFSIFSAVLLTAGVRSGVGS